MSRLGVVLFTAVMFLAACGGGGSKGGDGGSGGGGFDGPGNGDDNSGSDPKDPVGAQGAVFSGALWLPNGESVPGEFRWLLTEQAAGGSKSNLSAMGSYESKDAIELTTTSFPADMVRGGDLTGAFKLTTGDTSPLRSLLGASASGTFTGSVAYSTSGHDASITLTTGSTALRWEGRSSSDYYSVRSVSVKVGSFQEQQSGIEKGLVLTFADNASDDRGQKYNATGSTVDGCTYSLAVNQSNSGYNLYNIAGTEICAGASRSLGGQATFFNAVAWVLVINASDGVKNKRTYILTKS